MKYPRRLFPGLWLIGALVLWLACLVPEAQASPTLTLVDGMPPTDLIPYLEIMTDPNPDWTIADVSSPGLASRFAPASGEYPTLPREREIHWLRFRLAWSVDPSRLAEDQLRPWVLAMDYPMVREIDLYTPIKGRGNGGRPSFMVAKSGLDRPFRSREFPMRILAFRLSPNQAESETYYLRLKFRPNLPLNIKIYPGGEFLFFFGTDTMLAGLCLGAIICMILYNFFVYLSLRDRAYLFYVLYITSALGTIAFIYGQAASLVDMGFWIYMKTLWTMAGLMTIASFAFVRVFLETRHHAPGYDRIMRFMQVFGLAIMVVGQTGARTLPVWMLIFAGLFSPLIGTLSGIACLRRGYQPARYFLLAWTVLGLAIFVPALQASGLLAQGYFIHHLMPIGTALESILLSFALADRIRSLKQEREDLQNSERRLRALSLTDELTGLYNKRFLDSKLTSEVEHALRMDQSLSLLMIDVDDFKKLNDTHGHPEGDRVLIRLAELLWENLRETDSPCRYGGEEFAVILPSADARVAFTAAERIRRQLAREVFQFGEKVQVTVSVGLAHLQPGERGDRLLKRADRALYQAKRLGKNRTVMADGNA